MSIKIKNPKSATERVKDNAGATTGAKKSEYKFNDMAVTVPGTNLQVNIKPQETYDFSADKSSIAGLALNNKAKELGAEVVEDTPTKIEYAFNVVFTEYNLYDTTHTYNTGDKVSYGTVGLDDWKNYECKEDSVTGDWDESKWTDLEDYGFSVTETSGNVVEIAEGNDGTATLPESFTLYGSSATTTSPAESTSLVSDGSVVIGGVTLPDETLYFAFENCLHITVDEETVDGNVYLIYDGEDGWILLFTEAE